MKEMATADLAVVRRRINGWRKQYGGRGRRLPAELWSAAAAVARQHGVYAAARALGLSYRGLKDRVRADEAAGAFVEVNVSPVGGARGTVVELVAGDGAQVRIHLSGPWTADLVHLAEAFWSRRP